MSKTRVDNDLLNYHHELKGCENQKEGDMRFGGTEFMRNMSHEIRTPMNAIIGYTTLAKQHIDDRKQLLEYIEKISLSGNHLLNLINDVLDMSRIESGKFTLSEAPCSLREVMRELEAVMSGQIMDKKIDFYMYVDNIRNDAVMCDKLRLKQVFFNLLGNAVKFTPEGGSIVFDLNQKFLCSKEGYAGFWFRVKDTGIGMGEEFQNHLFEQFSRENNSTVSGILGTGLGLSITKNLVDMMDGKITVRSRLREGTEFIIDLNFPIAPNGPDGSPEKKPALDEDALTFEKKAAQRKMNEKKRLLLADDNPLNQEIAIEILKEYGYLTEVANNGSEAVEMVKNSEPGYYGAVLMDVQMPLMNGYEAAWRIRSLDDNILAGIPIIAMTANDFEEDRRMALMSGMNDFVTKPLEVKKLLAALAALVGNCA